MVKAEEYSSSTLLPALEWFECNHIKSTRFAIVKATRDRLSAQRSRVALEHCLIKVYVGAEEWGDAVDEWSGQAVGYMTG